MTTDSKPWRLKMYYAGLAAILVDLAVYLCGIVTVSVLVDHPAKQIRAGAWFFLIGSCVAIIAAILTLFGYGWKRLPLFVGCLLSLFLWVGFTLY
jgi:Na+-translocating ferredoxin:NAD+ oxidoreductase RnfE subunit